MLTLRNRIKLLIIFCAFSLLILSNCFKSPTDLGLPQILITFPVDGAYIKDSVTIYAEAVDNVEIKKVEFYVDGVSVSEDNSIPYTYKWFVNGLTKNHSIFAKAYDNNDDYGLSNIVTISILDTMDNESPQIAIVSPGGWSTVEDSIRILTSVSDNRGISKVIFYIDGDSVGTAMNEPYEFSWNTHNFINNYHTILAKAIDFNQNWTNTMITVLVQNVDTADTASPEIAIVSPGGWSTVRDSIRVLTSVSDNQGVSRVIFYIDGDSVATDMSEPFEFFWNTQNVTNDYHTILAKAIDFSQNWTNAMITVLVQNTDTTDIEPPQIAIVSPAGWSTVSATVNIRTEASDNQGVARVVFYIDGDSVYTDLTAPFNYNWNTNSVSNNYHTIIAKAYDSSQNWANSMITVLVQNK